MSLYPIVTTFFAHPKIAIRVFTLENFTVLSVRCTFTDGSWNGYKQQASWFKTLAGWRNYHRKCLWSLPCTQTSNNSSSKIYITCYEVLTWSQLGSIIIIIIIINHHHHHHQPSSTIINHHQPSSTIINHHHQPSSTIIQHPPKSCYPSDNTRRPVVQNTEQHETPGLGCEF